MARIALVRAVPGSLADCELTHLDRTPIDVAVARVQHQAYQQALSALGCEVRELPPAHAYPDSVFVEDTAVVLDELAIVTRPGAASRRGETEAVAAALAGHRRVDVISEPGTLDGGDVLRLGRMLYVGVGGRTNPAGVEQLRALVAPAGYEVRAVAVGECLHLKSAATEASSGCVLVNPGWVDPATFEGHRVVEVDPSEPGAANVLRIGNTLLSAEFPRTVARLERAGFAVRTVDVSELAKAEGAVTCCSLIVPSA